MVRYLLAVDISECHERQEAAARVRRMEASVAALLGLSMLYCMPSLRMKPEFLRSSPLTTLLSYHWFLAQFKDAVTVTAYQTTADKRDPLCRTFSVFHVQLGGMCTD